MWGIALLVFGALLVAASAGVIAQAASGMGQEVFNAGVLLAAVLMIGWHVVWMSSHARELTRHMADVGSKVSAGASSLGVLLAVVREGSEVVLFLFGMVAGGAHGLWAGLAIGIVGGTAVGFALYFGLLRIPVRHFFSATNWMLVLLAAGLASNAARYLAQADLLPNWGEHVWDSSWLLSDDSVLGRILHILVGYDARPSGMMLAFYLAAALLLALGTWISKHYVMPHADANAGGAAQPARG